MKFNYDGFANKGGVYEIRNLINNRCYVGSTSQFKDRWQGHRNSLTSNKHQNTFLQNDFNKSGSDAFVFSILEVVDGTKEERLDKEQVYLDQIYDYQQSCYNLQRKTHSSREGTRNKKAIDRATDGRCRQPSKEVLAKRSASLKQAVKDKPQLREICSKRAKEVRWKNHSANITIVHEKTGEEVVIKGSVREFCISRGLNYKAFHLLVKRKSKNSGGWILVTN